MWVALNDPLVALTWPDSEDVDPTVLTVLLGAAFEVCSAYAPPVTGVVPDRFKLAMILQARQIWSDLAGGDSQSIGADGFEISSFPLISAARQLLRPKVSAWSLIR